MTLSKSCMDFMMFSSYGHGARCEGGEVKRERKKSSSETEKDMKPETGTAGSREEGYAGASQVGKG